MKIGIITSGSPRAAVMAGPLIAQHRELIAGIFIGLARLTVLRWWRVPNNDPYLTASISPSVRGGDLILLWRLTKHDLVPVRDPRLQESVAFENA